MSFYDTLISKLPGIAEPKTHLNFKSRLKWTAIILLLFLILGQISLYGVAPTALEKFAVFEMILGSKMGTLMTLGIGPIVTASIILQLLVGSKLIPFDLKTEKGRAKFQGTQKLMVILFCIFEAYAYVAFGAVAPVSADPMMAFLLIGQIAFGGFLVLLMDEVVSKWGIGSGVSLFIAAGVTKTIFIGMFNPFTAPGESIPYGKIPQFISYMQIGEIFSAVVALLPIIATILVFAIVVYVQGIKVEIPLAFGSIRGFSRRWPLNLIYTSNIPVILTAALLANVQLIGSMMAKTVTETGARCGLLGCFDSNGSPVSGVVHFLRAPNSLSIQVFFLVLLAIVFLAGFMAFYFKFKKSFQILLVSGLVGFVLAAVASAYTVGLPTFSDSLVILTYVAFMLIGSTIFSIFWVSTSGMDAKNVAEQIESMGMQVPGFRRDPRIVEQVLQRYIPMLAIISGLFIGTLAAVADLTNALGTGTGILLTVMIVYNLYENIAMRYTEDMNPALRKFFQR